MIPIALLILALIIAIFFFVLWQISGQIIHPAKISYEQVALDLKERLNYSQEELQSLQETPFEEVTIRSNYGYDLVGRFFNQDTPRSVILLHREGRNLMASYKFLRMYQKLGFNVLMIDARYHGKSGGSNFTYGYFERWDLLNWVDFLEERIPQGFLGVHGESGGAATALMALPEDKRIDFAIADSSFTELLEVMRGLLYQKLHSKSKKILIIINQLIKRRAGFSLVDVSPLKEIEALEVPVLFIHGGADEIIPPRMSKILASFKSGFNQVYIAPGSKHLLAYYEHTKDYETILSHFLKLNHRTYLRHGRSYL